MTAVREAGWVSVGVMMGLASCLAMTRVPVSFDAAAFATLAILAMMASSLHPPRMQTKVLR